MQTNKKLLPQNTVYAPEAHIVYLTVVSCNGGERPEQGEQVPICTCSSTPLSIGPETSLVGSYA